MELEGFSGRLRPSSRVLFKRIPLSHRNEQKPRFSSSGSQPITSLRVSPGPFGERRGESVMSSPCDWWRLSSQPRDCLPGVPSLHPPQKLGFFGKCAPPGTRRNCASRLGPRGIAWDSYALYFWTLLLGRAEFYKQGKSKESSVDTLVMWTHLPRPDFQAAFSLLIYLSESPRSFELLAVFPPCPASFLLLYISTLRDTLSLLFTASPAPRPSPWPDNGQGDK